jgi:hypothetical protein
MKHHLKLGTLFLGAALFIASFNSCKKSDNTISADTQAADDNSYAEATYNDAFNAVNTSATTGGSFFKTSETLEMLSGASITIKIDSAGTKKTLTIDFGTGTVCKDGKTRSGQIIGSWNGRYRDSGTVISITFNNYTVNGDKVEGTKTVTNLGHNSRGNLHFSIIISNAKITTSKGTISWQSTRDREWVAGSNTPTIFDDVYNITGSASGTNIKGQTFTITITNALVVNLACRFIEAGTLTITSSASASSGIVDYGNGTCDDLATFTYNNKTYTFHMR